MRQTKIFGPIFVKVMIIAVMYASKLNNHTFNNFYAFPKVGQTILLLVTVVCSLLTFYFKLEGILLQN